MKNCPQCGSTNPDNARYCFSCGTLLVPADTSEPVAAYGQPYIVQPPQTVPSSKTRQMRVQQGIKGIKQTAGYFRPSKAKTLAFFSWVWEAFRFPSKKAVAPQWYAAMPILFATLLMSLSTIVVAHGSTANALSLISGGMGIDVFNQYFTAGVFFSSLFIFWIAYLVVVYASILSIWAASHLLGSPMSFFDAQNKYGRIQVPLSALYIVALLLGAMTLSEGAAFFFLLGLIIFGLSSTVFISKMENKRKIDDIFMWFFAQIIVRVFFAVIVFPLFGLLFWGAISAAFSSAAGAYASSMSMAIPSGYMTVWVVLGFIF
jgi:hypothetical protein